MKLPSWATCALVFATACGPGQRYGDNDWRPDASADSKGPDAASNTTGDAAVAPVCGELTFVFRDFRSDHVDMQSGAGIDNGLVQMNLGVDGKPVFAPTGAT